ncbi:MAG TPA: hypothetical protein DEA08_31000 [Planctomycetes bacterium]|nr:hypothetical protein [Planctomycetota bacterium]|tara:strand:- start:32 stop:2014 length:1983 start_codon:yes stop_codon:yes gene_type:complete
MKMRHFVAGLATCFALATSASAQDDQPSQYLGTERRLQTMRINVDVEGVDLADVMEQIGQKVGRNILVDPNVQETVTVSLREIPWREAVDVIAKMTRCEVEERPGDILLLTQPPKVTIQFTDANVRTVLQLLAAYSGKNIIISPQVTGDVTLDLKEVHWLRALHAIVKTVGDYEVVEETDDLLRVVTRSSIEQQLETVVFKLKFVRPPATYRAIPPASTGQAGAGQGNQASASVFIGSVQNVAAASINETFTLFRSLQAVVQNSGITGATLEYDDQTNSFIVTATKPLLNQLEKIIQKVDVRPSQIYTEVKFVSTRDNNNQNYGLEFSEGSSDRGLRWSNQQHGPFPQQDLTFFPGPNPLINSLSGGLLGNDPRQFTPIQQATNFQQGQLQLLQTTVPAGNLPFLIGEGGDLFNEQLSIPALLNFSQFNVVLNLIDRDDRSRTIQSPSLFMLDNQDAVIFVGDQVPYAEFETTQDASGNVQAEIREGARSPVAIGFSLFVQPHVVPDEDRVAMTVIPRVNDLVGTTSSIPGFERFAFGFNNLELNLPRTREQALVTHVMLEDTQTAVLGGLLTEVDTEIIKRVPILSSIPILGNIFTNTQTNKRVENLTIFITPTIIRQRKTVDSIFLRATKRLEKADYFYQKYEKPSFEDDEADEDEDE